MVVEAPETDPTRDVLVVAMVTTHSLVTPRFKAGPQQPDADSLSVVLLIFDLT